MTKRVALIIPTMDRGGAEKQLCMLATGLPTDQFEARVFLLTRDGPLSDDLRAAGIPVELIGKRFKADPAALFRLRRELKTFAPDIVHTWIFAANSFGRLAARLAGVPVIIASERCVDPWKSSWHGSVDRQLSKWTAAITTNSAGVRDFYTQRGIRPDLFRIIPNGIPPRTTNSITREEAFGRLGVPLNKKLILAVGRLWPQKRYRDLIWAADLMVTLRADTVLVIIGEGPQLGELMRHRDAVSSPDNVRFAGQRSDVVELLPHADLFWNGSAYEGQSNSIIEAMQASVPVVASDIAGNRDLVLPNQTGLLVAVGDRADFARQSNRLLEDSELAGRLATAARQRIESDFTVKAMIDGHVQLYRQLAC